MMWRCGLIHHIWSCYGEGSLSNQPMNVDWIVVPADVIEHASALWRL